MKCLIVVPEQDNITNWRKEFEKFHVSGEDVTVICYASLHKHTGTHWGLLVLDEVPHMDTEKRIKMLKSVNADHVLALGAVVDKDEMDSLCSVYGNFKNWRIPLNTAINWGILPGPEINVIHLQMDDTLPAHWFNGHAYTEKQMYRILNDKVDSAVAAYNACSNDWNKRKMLKAGNDRKKFLGTCKGMAIRKICDRLESEGKRFLCFCSSIKQAESLGGDRAYTSKSLKSMAHLEKFNNGEINSLFVVGKLIEGQNLVNIQCGVIGQLGGTERITVQELGRIMRSDKPVIYVPVFDGTKDDSFLYTLTANIPDRCIKHENF